MLSGTTPFKADNIINLNNQIMKGNYAPIKDISYQASNLISKLLEVEPKKRIKLDEILKHPWFISSDKTDCLNNKSKIIIK